MSLNQIYVQTKYKGQLWPWLNSKYCIPNLLQEALTWIETHIEGKFLYHKEKWGFVEKPQPKGVKTSLMDATIRMGHGRIFFDSVAERNLAKMAFATAVKVHKKMSSLYCPSYEAQRFSSYNDLLTFRGLNIKSNCSNT